MNTLSVRELAEQDIPAPNKTLEKLDFQLVKEYIGIPGWLNFEQPVKVWALSREQYQNL